MSRDCLSSTAPITRRLQGRWEIDRQHPRFPWMMTCSKCGEEKNLLSTLPKIGSNKQPATPNSIFFEALMFIFVFFRLSSSHTLQEPRGTPHTAPVVILVPIYSL